MERPTEGTFYEKELQKVERPDIFRVEKFLKKRIGNKKKECDGLDTVLISIVGFNPLILFQFLSDERTKRANGFLLGITLNE